MCTLGVSYYLIRGRILRNIICLTLMHECTLLCLKTKQLNNMFLLLVVLVCHIIVTRLMQVLLTFIDYCKKLDPPCLIQAKTKIK